MTKRKKDRRTTGKVTGTARRGSFKSDREDKDLLSRARGHLSTLPNVISIEGRTLAIGDLHGDLETVTRAVKKFERGEYRNILFLGDYIDRGEDSRETMDLVLRLMLKHTEKVHLLRGNHEILWVNSKHGFKDELYTKGLGHLHQTYNEIFAFMPLAAIVNGSVLGVHGGIPEGLPRISAIQRLPRNYEDPDDHASRTMLEMLWNDPTDEHDRFAPNTYRGVWKVYGAGAFDEFMERNGLGVLVRGHQRWNEGFRYFFDRRLLSVFSCKSYVPEQVTKAAVIDGSNIKVVAL